MITYYTREPPSVSSSAMPSDTIKQNGISNLAMSLYSGSSFLFGAFCSAFSGYAGMWVSVRANVR